MKPRLLDLFCGAGGAAKGYADAGFEVVGVDINPQPNYPFEFVQADALEHLRDDMLSWGQPLDAIDAIHASPPCQAYTSLQSMRNAGQHPELIGPTRELLEATGLPYVIENVEAALPHMRAVATFRLCGTSFGLGTYIQSHPRLRVSSWYELRRHRYFETNWPIGLIPDCAHYGRTVGIYGDHLRLGRRSSQGEFSGLMAMKYGREAMGIDWMLRWDELKEAIPPAYTEFIGRQLLAHLEMKEAA